MSMNEKNRHVSVPQPLPANYGPPVPPVGPGPGQGVGQQQWMPNTVHPSSYMAHPGYSSAYKNNGNTPVRAPGYLPPMHHGGYIPRYPPFDTQCQSFPYGKVHEGPARPLNPSSYTITKHFNSQSPYTDPSKDVAPPKNLETFAQSKSPHPTKEKNSQMHEKNGREDMLSSPSEGKSDSETNLTTTESCPDDTRSPTSCDKQENFDKTENSIKASNDSNSHSIEPVSKKCKNSDINNSDTNSEQDSQCFSSILNSNNQVKKDNSGMHPSYEMRIHNPPFSHSDNMYGMYPDGDRRIHNNLSHNPNMPSLNPHMNDSLHFGYHSLSHSNMSDVDKLSDLDFSEKSNTSENVFQVPSISSTTPPKIFPPIPPSPMSESWGEETKYYAPQDEMDTEKVPRKKRKRCGECPGCLQKQNCGRCGPCRSVRSHQICKMRKCESLKTKKEKAAEESMKLGRKGSRGGGGVDLVSESSRGASDVGVKVNGAAPYMPDNTGQHLGPQTVRNYVDQYHPQGGNSYQPPVMLNSYNSPNPQYGSSFIPQVPPPPHHPSVFENRTSVDGMMEVDAPNSTHRMTNSRLKTLIHNRQNQRGGGGEHGQQLMPICNPPPPHHHEPSFSYPSQQQYHHLPPANHGVQQQNSMLFSSSENSSLMHLQQLSPSSMERPHAAALSWSESSSNVPVKQPLVESSPPAAQQAAPPSQNGLTTSDSTEETTTTTTKAAMNGTEQQPAAESTSSTNCALEQQQPPPNSSERVEAPNAEVESEKSSNKIPTAVATSSSSCDNHVMMTPPPPRYTTPGFLTPPGHAYRPPPNCLPPTNGVPNDTNCEESTQSSPFLLNTTTSMNTYINITSTYNSKLSFSNATCLPTFASTRVKNSSPTYSTGQYLYHLDSNNNSTYSLPKGGGTAMSCIDSGRIQDTFNNIVPPDTGHQQGLPLPDFCYDKPPTQQLDRIEKIRNNTKLEPPQCDCFKNKEVLPSEKVPYYTHLGSGSSVSAIRELVEYRSGEKGNAIRIEKLLYSGKEGKTSQGCPLAKWIIRRSGPEEKFLTVIRHRPGHTCTTAYIIIAMVAWEGISQSVADMLYQTVVYKTVNFGIPTQRKCATNDMRTCACQGLDPETCGASFSFGCSWSMYYNGCKFARSKNARKFKLTEKDEEKELEDKLQNLATDVAQLYERMAPDSFQNQVVTLTKHRGWTKPEDEQLHVLPLYVMDSTDEYGSKEGQDKKITSGSLEVLTKYPVNFRVRTTPLKPCKTRGRKPKDGFSPRRLAVQNAFRQLIASGKLHRIEPPVNLLKSNCNFKFPDSSALAYTRECDSDKTACKFYAGKHILSSCGKFQNVSDNLACSQNSSATCFDSPASCHNMYSNTEPSSLILSSSEECAYNNASQSSLPHCAHPQFYSYCSDHNTDAYSYGSSYSNGETSNTSSFHNPYLYQYAAPNIPLKIPGNYCAASRFQHSSNAHYQTYNSHLPYSGQPFNYCHSLSDGSDKNVFSPLQSNCDSRFGSYQNYQKDSFNDSNGVFLVNREKRLELNDVGMQNTNPGMESRSKKEDVVSAQNYNYHLQQSNLILDFDNISDIYSGSAATKKDVQNDDEKYRRVCPVDEESPMNGDEIYEGESDNEASFRDVEVGGVAIALTHGSVLFECAKHELHATTALKKPNRTNPTRISLVFYQHKHLNYRNHGEAEWGQKVKDKQQSFDDHAKKTRLQDPDDTPMRRLVATTPTTSWVTVVSIAPYPVGQ